MRIFDEDTANDAKAEERQYEQWQINEKNRILRMSNERRKQEAWNKLYPKLAIEGLTEEELNQPY